MKAIHVALWLMSTTAAIGSTEIQRERFSLVLPAGWSESPEVRPMVIPGDDYETREKTFPRFIAATKDCSCIVSFLPQSPQVTARSLSALQISSFRSNSTVYRESVIKSVGGREGFGSELFCRHPYPVISVVRVFSFESEGYICTLLITTSDQKEEPAAQRMTRHLADIDAITKSIKIRKADDAPVQKKANQSPEPTAGLRPAMAHL